MFANAYLSEFILLFVLILLSGVFSSAETSLTAISTFKLRKLVSEKRRNVVYLEKLFEKPGRMLTTILVGNNIVNILISIIGTILFLDILSSYGITNIAFATTIITAMLTIVLLIFGEISPKTMALKNSERFALALSRPIYYLSVLLWPVIVILNLFSKLIIKITGGQGLERGALVSEEEIKLLINIGRKEGVLEEDEEKMLNSIIEFGDIIAKEIMTPRTDIIAAEINCTPRKIVKTIRSHGHSRIPVYSDKIDNMVGFVYAKDLLSVPDDKQDSISYFKNLVRGPFCVPETKKIDELLSEMRHLKKHVAIVIDEYGGTSGLISIEDIIEEIVGDIRDEYDESEEPITKISESEYIISGVVHIADINEKLDLDLPEEEDYDSVAGFIVDRLGAMPAKGDIVEFQNLTFAVADVKKRRIIKIKLVIKKESEEQVDD